MKSARLVLFLILGMFLFVGAAAAFFNAQGGGELFTDAPQTPEQIQASGIDQAVDEPAVLRTRYTGVNLPAAERIQPGETLTLRLFDDAVFTLLPGEINRDGTQVAISGPLQDVPDSLAVLTVVGSQMALDVFMPAGVYQARWLANGVYAIRQIDQSAFPEELPPLEVSEATLAESGQAVQEFPAASSDISADDGSIIEVLVVYTANARILNGGTNGIQALITNAVNATNISYANSGVTQRLHLANMREVTYSDTGDLQTDLMRLQNVSDGYMDEVHTWRNDLNADVVNLIVGSGNACGVGYQMSSINNSFNIYAFSVVFDDCAVSNFSLAHELGHNMGARHDWFVDPGLTPYRYSHGHINFPNRWRTIMSYNDYCANLGFNCTRIQYWSNPNLTYGGSPLGVPENTCTGSVGCDADNARTLNNSAYTVANFRVAATPTATPTATATATQTPTPTATLTPTITPTPTSTPPYNVLLVDEDDNNPDVRGYYATPLATLKVTVTVRDVGAQGEPGAAQMASNETVIWFTGDSYASSAGPETATENALASWLQAGNCFFITGQDYAYARSLSGAIPNAFMKNYLGVAAVSELSFDGVNGGQSIVTGWSSPFAGFGSYTLKLPSGFTGNYTDQIQPVQKFGIAFQGNQGPAGVYYESLSFKTMYWGFPFEAIPGLEDRTAIMRRLLYWCRWWENTLPLIRR